MDPRIREGDEEARPGARGARLGIFIMTKKYFIAGTDTSIGKTYVAAGLLRLFKQAGFSTVGIKPVASGSIIKSKQGVGNKDALELQKAASIKLPYKIINPFLFQEPIAPHIAAQRENVPLSVNKIMAACRPGLNSAADVTLIEGCGGWQVPLNNRETMADFVRALKIPVILVVGMRLGCINHTLLTLQSMQTLGIELSGWIANCFLPRVRVRQENIETLSNWLPAPLLGVIGYKQKPEHCINHQLLD